MTTAAGEEAPDFELQDQHGQRVRLSSLRGAKAALIVFYPWAFSRVCGGELAVLQSELEEIAGEDLALLAVSTDPIFALRAYADNEGITFQLLSDLCPHGAVAKDYGVFSVVVGIALRGSFLVDRDGVVRWTVVNDIPDARDLEEYKVAIAAL
jgi:peroxiredoxin